FAFVESMGPVYAGKLLGDSLGLHRRRAGAGPAPAIPGLGPEERAETAESILRAMSLTDNFARLVVFVGHGAGVSNNPHAGTLQCGACGGHAGDVNARALAGLLNDPEVRARLAGRGIPIPADTLFVGALHDTTSDRVTLFDGDAPSSAHRDDVARLAQRFDTAGELARDERARRLPRARRGSDVAARGRNWAELRPEWGLAGCSAFIVAPRHRTRGRDLGGRAFLHSYEWRDDEGFRVLEQILTAPVVVASWINLQYYGSTVAPDTFGGGSKVLHNVTGGIGVVEGNGGALRTGLPWQSVHDGDRSAHHPLRLTVVIEAPTAAIDGALRRHDDVRAMFDNRWAHLLALDESGQLAWRYHRAGHWTPWTGERDAAPVAAAG
ncbi:putative inorganic carbon transporter subunit DabA, partial [Arhodomonas sp. KWT]